MTVKFYVDYYIGKQKITKNVKCVDGRSRSDLQREMYDFTEEGINLYYSKYSDKGQRCAENVRLFFIRILEYTELSTVTKIKVRFSDKKTFDITKAIKGQLVF